MVMVAVQGLSDTLVTPANPLSLNDKDLLLRKSYTVIIRNLYCYYITRSATLDNIKKSPGT